MSLARAWGRVAGGGDFGQWEDGREEEEDDEISLEMEGTGDHEGRPYRCWLG